MRHYALIGRSVERSLSKSLFDAYCAEHGITDAEYTLCNMTPDRVKRDALREWVAERDLQGFNVTMPYKSVIMQGLDKVDDEANTIGAVNCVTRHGDRLVGYNTDTTAFAQTLTPLLKPRHCHALILGTGGAAHAVAYALQQIGIDYRLVSRTPDKAHPNDALLRDKVIGMEQAIEQASLRLLIVNATPVGMSDDTEGNPWKAPHLLSHDHLCYDLIYYDTPFLAAAHRQGATAINGFAMLRLQALLSYKHFRLVNCEE